MIQDYTPSPGKGIIYMYTLDNGEKYIGKTTRALKQRHQQHMNYSECPLIDNKLKKHNFDLEVIWEGDESKLNEMEIHFIKLYNTLRPNGLNLTKGGDGCRCSEETKKKISDRRKGIVYSKETLLKMSESHKGKTHSEETKFKMSESHKGRKKSTDVRHNMSIAQRQVSKGQIKVICYDLETQEELLGFYSMNAVKRHLGISSGNIGRCLDKVGRSAGGYGWKSVKEVI